MDQKRLANQTSCQIPVKVKGELHQHACVIISLRPKQTHSSWFDVKQRSREAQAACLLRWLSHHVIRLDLCVRTKGVLIPALATGPKPRSLIRILMTTYRYPHNCTSWYRVPSVQYTVILTADWRWQGRTIGSRGDALQTLWRSDTKVTVNILSWQIPVSQKYTV